MPQSNLIETLRDLVRLYGTSAVLHSLAEIQSSSDVLPSTSSSKGTSSRKARPGATNVKSSANRLRWQNDNGATQDRSHGASRSDVRRQTLSACHRRYS